MGEKELRELENIKHLLILLLIKLGTHSEEIGLALKIDASGVRKMFPMRKIKTIKGLK